jgi:hypothetical protein
MILGTDTSPCHPEDWSDPADCRNRITSSRKSEAVCSDTELVLLRNFLELLVAWDAEESCREY